MAVNRTNLWEGTAVAGANLGGSTNATSDNVGVAVDVSAVSGTSPTLNITIQWSPDGINFGDADTTADTMVQLTAEGTVAKAFVTKGPYFRLLGTVGGTATPTVTFHAVAVTH